MDVAEAKKLAEGSEQKAEPKSPEELKKDADATELLKELEAEESGPGEEGAKGAAGDAKPAGEKPDEEEAGADESGTQPGNEAVKSKRGFGRRVSKLVKQRDSAISEKDVAIQEAAEKEKLLRMRISQLEKAKEAEVVEPDPDEFDGGELDPDFVKAKKDYDIHQFRQIAREEAANAAKTGSETATQQQKASELKRKQEEHWAQADELGGDDYQIAEDKAVEVLGADMVNNIIDFFPGESAQAIFYLGLDKNAVEAEELAEMFASGPKGVVKGTAGVGRILERLKGNPIKPKSAPDPDEETEGSAPSPTEALQNKLDKLRDDAAKTGRSDGMKRILAFKRKAKERGITLT